MLKFLADEDFNNRIVRGLRRRSPALDIVRAQEVGLIGTHDAEVLAWAARENRLLLTHDTTTMIDFAIRRVSDVQPMPGLIAIAQNSSIGGVIDDLILLAQVSSDTEWDSQVIFLPFR